ncbi:UTP--glucose-1-phosphate uridylyltransferase GalU [Legionella dresdenensis]|uniref:UTP--glucose-1-phosphate uridylyltransferase n=1 Tax=Legionella dresdenensis TaxID=450200 RepID=A0ABV8CCE3_9GAMM
MQVKKAVFPVAGLGTRFLPATKANPKEMLPIVDKPLIQYAVDEAVRAGITHMIFITSSSKRAIEDHFDNNFELEFRLREQAKLELLDLVSSISPPGIEFSYVRQNQPLGLGHAILCAEHVIGNEAFAVLLADDLIDDSRIPCLSAMTEHFRLHGQSQVAIQSVPWHQVNNYGVVSLDDAEQRYSQILAMVEKPDMRSAPSNLAAVGRYIFNPSIFDALKQVGPDERGEIQLTDGIKQLIPQETIIGYTFNGKRYDCGSKLGYMQAMIEFGLRHPEIGEQLAEYLANREE